MNDRQPEQTSRQGAETTDRFPRAYPPYADPAYARQSPYAPPQYPRMAPNLTEPNPTAKLPQYWLQDQYEPHQPTQQLQPGRPKTPRWLWIAAAAAVLLVTALVIALVIANGSAKKQSAVAPLPAMPNSKSPASTTSAPPSSMPSSMPSSTVSPTPSGTATSPPGSGAGAVDPVVYNVTGEGRAISITYRDSDGVIQTEFNVALPWSKEVNLPKSGNHANVTIVNIGHDVTCTVAVAGAQVRHHTGAGLTVCDAPA